MLNELKEWVQAVLPTYGFSQGMWVDTPQNTTQFIASLHMMGGPTSVDERRPIFRVLLLGPRDGRQYATTVGQNMEALVLASEGDSVPCGAAAIKNIVLPSGPGYTTENRAWVSADFQLIL